MDNQQLEALEQLSLAITNAHARGIFDILPCYVHPDIINGFIDAVDVAMIEEHKLLPT